MTSLKPESLAQEGPPRGLTLLAYARISADLAEGDRPAELVLASHDLTPEAFAEVSMFWTQRMAQDLQNGDGSAKVTHTFSQAFTQAQDAKKPLVPLSVEEWAILTLQIEQEGSLALTKRGLSSADHMRLVRHWARTLGERPELAARYDAARSK